VILRKAIQLFILLRQWCLQFTFKSNTNNSRGQLSTFIFFSNDGSSFTFM